MGGPHSPSYNPIGGEKLLKVFFFFFKREVIQPHLCFRKLPGAVSRGGWRRGLGHLVGVCCESPGERFVKP